MTTTNIDRTPHPTPPSDEPPPTTTRLLASDCRPVPKLCPARSIVNRRHLTRRDMKRCHATRRDATDLQRYRVMERVPSRRRPMQTTDDNKKDNKLII
uniref:Uncharacterized protein n=1 Tax=Plectus sambesii TaxID=2011161 RepID=A0A914V763_9BILA